MGRPVTGAVVNLESGSVVRGARRVMLLFTGDSICCYGLARGLVHPALRIRYNSFRVFVYDQRQLYGGLSYDIMVVSII